MAEEGNSKRFHSNFNEQRKIEEWLIENWEKRVIANRMNRQAVADAIVREKGLVRPLKASHVTYVISQRFPQWLKKLTPKPPAKAPDGANLLEEEESLDDELDGMHASIGALDDETKRLAEELGALERADALLQECIVKNSTMIKGIQVQIGELLKLVDDIEKRVISLGLEVNSSSSSATRALERTVNHIMKELGIQPPPPERKAA